MALQIPLPGQVVNASSASQNIALLNAMGSAIANSSGTITGTSALLFANQILGASSAMSSMLLQMQAGYQVSS